MSEEGATTGSHWSTEAATDKSNFTTSSSSSSSGSTAKPDVVHCKGFTGKDIQELEENFGKMSVTKQKEHAIVYPDKSKVGEKKGGDVAEERVLELFRSWKVEGYTFVFPSYRWLAVRDDAGTKKGIVSWESDFVIVHPGGLLVCEVKGFDDGYKQAKSKLNDGVVQATRCVKHLQKEYKNACGDNVETVVLVVAPKLETAPEGLEGAIALAKECKTPKNFHAWLNRHLPKGKTVRKGFQAVSRELMLESRNFHRALFDANLKDVRLWRDGGSCRPSEAQCELLKQLCFHCNKVVTIFGPAGSGKTVTCLAHALNCRENGKSVLFVTSRPVGRDHLRLWFNKLEQNGKFGLLELRAACDDRPGSNYDLVVLDEAQHYRKRQRYWREKCKPDGLVVKTMDWLQGNRYNEPAKADVNEHTLYLQEIIRNPKDVEKFVRELYTTTKLLMEGQSVQANVKAHTGPAIEFCSVLRCKVLEEALDKKRVGQHAQGQPLSKRPRRMPELTETEKREAIQQAIMRKIVDQIHAWTKQYVALEPFRQTVVVLFEQVCAEDVREQLRKVDNTLKYGDPTQIDRVWVAHVDDMRGLEREFVILVKPQPDAFAADKIYVGFSRATFGLAIVDEQHNLNEFRSAQSIVKAWRADEKDRKATQK